MKNNRPADASVIKRLPLDATSEQAATLTPARIAAERQNMAAAEETDLPAALRPPKANRHSGDDIRTLTPTIVIIADDMTYGELGCAGSNTIKTPHINRIAATSTFCRAIGWLGSERGGFDDETEGFAAVSSFMRQRDPPLRSGKSFRCPLQ